MEFSLVPQFSKRKSADLLVVPYWQEKHSAQCAAEIGALDGQLAMPIKLGDFKGKEGESTLLYIDKHPEKRVALLGLGKEEEFSVEGLRRSYAAAVKLCHQHKMETLNLLLPVSARLSKEEIVQGIAEGMLLINYSYDALKGFKVKDEPVRLVKKAALIGAENKYAAVVNKAHTIAEAIYFARDLVNGNAEDVTPQHLAAEAKKIAHKHKEVKTTVFDKKRIQKEGMGLLLAVNQGSQREPALIIMEYKGNPRSQDHTVIVGKGITYDTGGLDLKPSGSMLTMKADMSGAASAFGIMLAAAKLGLKVNLTVVVPSTENCIGSKSYKPGDVFKSYLGKTVEIGNTDAEGRLALADAVAYVNANLAPTRMIDLATLTGGIVIALGEQITGLMSNDDELAHQLLKSSEATSEPLWRMPLRKEYREHYRSDIADIKNCGGRAASSITGALFIEEFVGKTPWAHFDIAGTAFLSKSRTYHPIYASGVAIRLLLNFLEAL